MKGQTLGALLVVAEVVILALTPVYGLPTEIDDTDKLSPATDAVEWKQRNAEQEAGMDVVDVLDESMRHGPGHDNPERAAVKEKRCKEMAGFYDNIVGAARQIALPLAIRRRDLQDDLKRSQCNLCREGALCKLNKKCDLCNALCKNVASTPLDIKQSDTTNANEVVGTASRMNINDDNSGLSETQDRYYTVGSFGTGPKQSLLARLLNIPRSANLERLVVLAKNKSKGKSMALPHPVVIDTAHVFTRNEGKPIKFDLELHDVKGEDPDIQHLTAQLNRELDIAIETKKKMVGDSHLTPAEIDKIIDHAIVQHHNFQSTAARIASKEPTLGRTRESEGTLDEINSIENETKNKDNTTDVSSIVGMEAEGLDDLEGVAKKKKKKGGHHIVGMENEDDAGLVGEPKKKKKKGHKHIVGMGQEELGNWDGLIKTDEMNSRHLVGMENDENDNLKAMKDKTDMGIVGMTKDINLDKNSQNHKEGIKKIINNVAETVDNVQQQVASATRKIIDPIHKLTDTSSKHMSNTHNLRTSIDNTQRPNVENQKPSIILPSSNLKKEEQPPFRARYAGQPAKGDFKEYGDDQPEYPEADYGNEDEVDVPIYAPISNEDEQYNYGEEEERNEYLDERPKAPMPESYNQQHQESYSKSQPAYGKSQQSFGNQNSNYGQPAKGLPYEIQPDGGKIDQTQPYAPQPQPQQYAPQAYPKGNFPEPAKGAPYGMQSYGRKEQQYGQNNPQPYGSQEQYKQSPPPRQYGQNAPGYKQPQQGGYQQQPYEQRGGQYEPKSQYAQPKPNYEQTKMGYEKPMPENYEYESAAKSENEEEHIPIVPIELNKDLPVYVPVEKNDYVVGSAQNTTTIISTEKAPTQKDVSSTTERNESWFQTQYHKLRNWVEENVGMAPELDKISENAKKNKLVDKFTTIIKHDLTEGHNLTQTAEKEVDKSISKLISENIESGASARLADELNNIENMAENNTNAETGSKNLSEHKSTVVGAAPNIAQVKKLVDKVHGFQNMPTHVRDKVDHFAEIVNPHPQNRDSTLGQEAIVGKTLDENIKEQNETVGCLDKSSEESEEMYLSPAYAGGEIPKIGGHGGGTGGYGKYGGYTYRENNPKNHLPTLDELFHPNSRHHQTNLLDDLLHPNRGRGSEIQSTTLIPTIPGIPDLIKDLNKLNLPTFHHQHKKHRPSELPNIQLYNEDANAEQEQNEFPEDMPANHENFNMRSRGGSRKSILGSPQEDERLIPNAPILRELDEPPKDVLLGQRQNFPDQNPQTSKEIEEMNELNPAFVPNPVTHLPPFKRPTDPSQEEREEIDRHLFPEIRDRIPPLGFLSATHERQPNQDLRHFGKIVPESLHDLNIHNRDVSEQLPHKKMYFVGDGIHLPLHMKEHNDGTLHLSVDVQKLCKCNSTNCNKNKDPSFMDADIKNTPNSLDENDNDINLGSATPNLNNKRSKEDNKDVVKRSFSIPPPRQYYDEEYDHISPIRGKYDFSNLNNEINNYYENEDTFQNTNGEDNMKIDYIQKRVGILKDVLSWMKDVAMDGKKNR